MLSMTISYLHQSMVFYKSFNNSQKALIGARKCDKALYERFLLLLIRSFVHFFDCFIVLVEIKFNTVGFVKKEN